MTDGQVQKKSFGQGTSRPPTGTLHLRRPSNCCGGWRGGAGPRERGGPGGSSRPLSVVGWEAISADDPARLRRREQSPPPTMRASSRDLRGARGWCRRGKAERRGATSAAGKQTATGARILAEGRAGGRVQSLEGGSLSLFKTKIGENSC